MWAKGHDSLYLEFSIKISPVYAPRVCMTFVVWKREENDNYLTSDAGI